MKFRSSSRCIGLNSVCLHVGVRIYKQICRGSPSDCESVREIFHPPLAEADPAKPCIGLNRYLYHRKVPGHPTPACPCSHDQQSVMHIVVFCPRHAAGQAEMYHCAGTSLYRELLAKPKAAKAVID